MCFTHAPALLAIMLLISLVGCYTNIPAALPEPVCQISRAMRKESAATTSSRTGQERVVVDGQFIDVYSVSSVRYSYDLQRRLIRKRTTGSTIAYDEEYSYAPNRLYGKTVYYAQDGTVSDVYAYSVGLSEQGYGYRRTYNEKWQDGNLMHKEESAVDYLVYFDYTYDLTRPALPNPHQFDGILNKNLLTSSIVYPTVSGKIKSAYSYYFDSQGRVKRKIDRTEYVNSFEPKSFITTTVTDYEYECP